VPPAPTSRGSHAWKERREGRQRRVRRQEGESEEGAAERTAQSLTQTEADKQRHPRGGGKAKESESPLSCAVCLLTSPPLPAFFQADSEAQASACPSCGRLLTAFPGRPQDAAQRDAQPATARQSRGTSAQSEQTGTAAACFGQSRCRKSALAVGFAFVIDSHKNKRKRCFRKMGVALVWKKGAAKK
jgi:hypothetical protein